MNTRGISLCMHSTLHFLSTFRNLRAHPGVMPHAVTIIAVHERRTKSAYAREMDNAFLTGDKHP